MEQGYIFKTSSCSPPCEYRSIRLWIRKLTWKEWGYLGSFSPPPTSFHHGLGCLRVDVQLLDSVNIGESVGRYSLPGPHVSLWLRQSQSVITSDTTQKKENSTSTIINTKWSKAWLLSVFSLSALPAPCPQSLIQIMAIGHRLFSDSKYST